MKPIDFEFFNSNEPHPTLVCAAMAGRTYWLFDGSESKDWKKLVFDIWNAYYDTLQSNRYLAYYAVAEARCFLTLGIDPLKVEWIDLYAEFKMQQNCNNKFQYGHYIDKDGSVKFSEPPVPGEEDDEINKRKVPANLINGVYKNTRQIISSAEKEEIRGIILSKNADIINRNKQRILDYCLEDTTYLEPMYDNVCEYYKQAGLRGFESDMLSRGAYAAATAKCEQVGIPINIDLLNKVIDKTPEIIENSRDEINKSIPLYIKAYTPEPKVFKKGQKYSFTTGKSFICRADRVQIFKEIPAHKDTKILQGFIESLNISEWPRTDSGLYQTDKEAFETYRYIPEIEALYQHNKTETSLGRFKKENSDGFFEAFGSDNKVRPFYGIFGTQTGRNAAKAKTFPLAMSSWLRAIISPEKGQYIIAADFSQQEVAVAAALSGDRNLRLAYDSGDVYLEFAKQAGLIPHSATKKTHKAERDLCKSTVLGLQYGMGRNKLQHKLSYDSGAMVSMEKTLELINAHKTVFSTYWQWVYDISNMYDRGYPIITPDGWVLWQDNPIKTSVRNAPVQGTSASITRRATVDAWNANLTVMCQLHDALYCLSSKPKEDEVMLHSVMTQAVKKILGPDSIDIRIDMKIISHDEIWVEEKSAKEWEKIKGFLT